jgi:hypothetical protein
MAVRRGTSLAGPHSAPTIACRRELLMIERLIASPMPIPLLIANKWFKDFVRAEAGLIPTPESHTLTRISSEPLFSVAV